MADGKIKSAAPNMVKLQDMIASRVANIVAPTTMNSIFDKLAEGGAGIDPRSGMKSTSVLNADSPMTGTLKALQNQLNSESRDSLVNRTGISLPNLAYKPKTGVGTASQLKPRTNGIAFKPEFEVEGASAGTAAAQKGNTVYVDDKGWPVTLKQLLGSHMLTPDMLKKASIQNVSNLIQVTGGTRDQQTEMKYMLQRMILEGMVRGVDITQKLKDYGGVKYQIGNYTGAMGVHTGGGNIKFNADTGANWDTMSEASRYKLFIHETGHALLGAQHASSNKTAEDDRVMTALWRGGNTAGDKFLLTNYDKMMDGLFNENHYAMNKIGVSDHGQSAQFDQSWFPSLTGVGENPYQSNTGAATPNNAAREKLNQSIYNNSYTVVPPTINMANNQQQEAPGRVQQAPGSSAGPQASGSLDGNVLTPTKTFAAGMADLSKKNEGADMERAGALLKSG